MTAVKGPKYRVGRAQAAWRQSTTARVRPPVPVAVAAAGVLAGVLVDHLAVRVLLGLVAAAALLRLAVPRRVRVEMDLYSVRARYGMFPGVVRLPLRVIRSVRAVEVSGRDWFGAGYRVLPHRGTAMLARTGPALEFTLVSGRVLVVSLDDPGTARDVYERIRAKHVGS